MSEEENNSPTGLKEDKLPYLKFAAGEREALPNKAEADFVWQAKGQSLPYTAIADYLAVRNDAGQLTGQMFSLSYIAKEKKNRPVSFVFNGGPGCASVPVNFGGFGPKTIKKEGISHLGNPIEVEDNPNSLLPDTDLVFLDALGTGFSAIAEGVDEKKVFGIDADADAFARAIAEWLRRHKRWTSPIYLIGESYGTVRNAALARLLGEHGIKLAGVVEVSALFDWVQVLEGSELYHVGMLPTYAAAAHYFKKVASDLSLEEHFNKALTWAEEVYAPALMKGSRLGAEAEAQLAGQMSEFIGLPKEYILRKHLRIVLDDFRKHLLEDEALVTGRLDLRFVSDAPSPLMRRDSWFEMEDAADDAFDSSIHMAFRQFLSEDLKYDAPARYLHMNYMHIGSAWVFEHMQPGVGESSLPNVAYDLSTALRRNPNMKLAIVGGRFDAATPWYNVVHDLSGQFLSPEAESRIHWYLYNCGHMPYVDLPTAEQMAKDLHEFFAE